MMGKAMKSTYSPETDKDELLDIYRRVLGGEQVLKQRTIEIIEAPKGITRKEKDTFYSREEAALGIRKMQGLDIEKQQIEVSDLANRLISARKRTSEKND